MEFVFTFRVLPIACFRDLFSNLVWFQVLLSISDTSGGLRTKCFNVGESVVMCWYLNIQRTPLWSLSFIYKSQEIFFGESDRICLTYPPGYGTMVGVFKNWEKDKRLHEVYHISAPHKSLKTKGNLIQKPLLINGLAAWHLPPLYGIIAVSNEHCI